MSLFLMVAFGVLTGLEAPAIAQNLPTPMIGVWERISISIYMLWVIVFAVILLNRRDFDRVDAGKPDSLERSG